MASGVQASKFMVQPTATVTVTVACQELGTGSYTLLERTQLYSEEFEFMDWQLCWAMTTVIKQLQVTPKTRDA
jgi:hypothetical protein